MCQSINQSINPLMALNPSIEDYFSRYFYNEHLKLSTFQLDQIFLAKFVYRSVTCCLLNTRYSCLSCYHILRPCHTINMNSLSLYIFVGMTKLAKILE